jgi:hypothetical protein
MEDSDFDASKCFGQSPGMQQGNLIETHEQAGDFRNGKKETGDSRVNERIARRPKRSV